MPQTYRMGQQSHVKKDRSSSRENHSIHSSKSQRPHFLRNQYIQHLQFPSERQKTVRQMSHSKDKQQPQSKCSRCQSMKAKLRQRQDHFKQVIDQYHKEMDCLKQINDQLREELQAVSMKADLNLKQLSELNHQLQQEQKSSLIEHSRSFVSLQKKKLLQQNKSLIGQAHISPAIIKRLAENNKKRDQSKIKEEKQTVSLITQKCCQKGNPVNQLQKQNALRAQFERLMGECQSTCNRSKKTTLRKQLASIANQLCGIPGDIVGE